jgi:hypothetical protein
VWHSAPCSHAAVTLVILRSLSLFMLGNETLGADA